MSAFRRHLRRAAVALVLVGLPELAAAEPGGLVPVFTKSFSPSTIGPGSVTTLTFQIDNGNSPLPATALAFSDVLPAGVLIASPGRAATTCSDAILSAPDGGSSIGFSEGRLPPNSNCSVTVDVTSAVPGTHTNISGDLTSSVGNSGPATADLVVASNRPGFTKSFAPSVVALGGVSTLTLTIDNAANGGNVDLLSFTDTLPAGLEVAAPANLSTTCSGGALPVSVTATPGSSTVAMTFGFVAAGATCQVAVDVLASLAGQLGNTTGVLTYTGGGQSGRAAAVLDVTVGFLNETFTNDPTPPGGTVDLQFTLTNFDGTNPATNITFTDDLDAALSGLVAVGLPLADPCGPGSSLSGTSLLTLTSGQLAPGGSCTMHVTLQVPAAATPGAYANTTSQVSLDLGGTPSVRPAASDTLLVLPVPLLTKSFVDDPVAAGGSVTLQFSITNTSATDTATAITFSDDIDAVVPGLVPTLPMSGFCGVGSTMILTVVVDSRTLLMSGGSLAAGDSCTFSVPLQVPAGVAGGPYPNVTSPISATVGDTPLTGPPASDTLVVLGPPHLSKAFASSALPGGTVTLQFEIEYPPNATAGASDIAFTDDLGSVLSGLVATGLPANDVCGAGSQISGTGTLSLTGGNLVPGGTCSFPVTLQVPPAAVPGAYVNTTSAVTATVGGQALSGNQATDTLVVGGLAFTKSFTDDPALPGGTVTLQFTIENQSAAASATGLAFTDNLSATLAGLTAVGLPANDVCGTGSQIGGTTLLSLTGGNLSPGASCTFPVTLQVPAGAAPGEHLNTTSPLNGMVDGQPATAPAASDTLLVLGALSLSKSFTDDPASPGGTVTLEFTISNSDPVQAATGLAFTDDLDAVFPGLVAVGLPVNDVCGVGSQLSGTGLLTLAAGSLPASGTCTFSATLQLPSGLNANVTNTTSQITGTVGGQAVTGSPASDVLQVAQADLSVVHTLELTDPVAPHGALAYRLQIANAGPGPAPSVRLADLLPPGTTFVSSTPAAPACVPAAGGLDCDLGDLAPGASTTVDVALTVDQNASGVVTNSATVSSDAVDGALADNSTSETTTVQFVKGDLNYDARTDLVLRNGVTGETLAWEMDGTLKVGESSLSPALAASQAVGGTDDFTGDRRTDLVLRDASTGAVEFWALDGTTRQGAAIPLTGQALPPLGWEVVASNDFNADGHPDLLWYDTTSRQLVVWTLDGTQYLGSVVPSPSQSVDGNWRVVAALDFNGDGHPDLLWFNLNSRKIVLWFMDGSVTRTLGAFTTPSSATDGNWTVLAAGDYGLGPGQAGTPVPGSNDIVWRNESSGRFVVWHMDLAGMRTGGTFTTPPEPPAPATDWTLVGPR